MTYVTVLCQLEADVGGLVVSLARGARGLSSVRPQMRDRNTLHPLLKSSSARTGRRSGALVGKRLGLSALEVASDPKSPRLGLTT
jgi:hypothetical protein